MAAIGDMPEHQRRRESALIAEQNRGARPATVLHERMGRWVRALATPAAAGQVREEIRAAMAEPGPVDEGGVTFAVLALLRELDEPTRDAGATLSVRVADVRRQIVLAADRKPSTPDALQRLRDRLAAAHAETLAAAWSDDTRASNERRFAVRAAWPEIGQRLDDLADTTTTTEEE